MLLLASLLCKHSPGEGWRAVLKTEGSLRGEEAGRASWGANCCVWKADKSNCVKSPGDRIVGGHRKTRLIEDNAKCHHLKELTYKGNLRQMFILLWPRSPSLPPHTIYVYTVYLFTHGRGESWTREKVREATVHKVGSKNTNMTDCISSL